MRALAALLIAALPLSAQAWEHDLAAAQKRAKAEKKLIFADVWTEWCGWCIKLQKDVFPSPEGKAALATVVPVSLKTQLRNGAPTELKHLEERFQVEGFPMLLILDADGNVVRSHAGYLPPKEFAAWVKGK
ncbi:thioredoxin family protein [Holophaga foetida]|uniref:thioredoxin family protein n=1 Tax=Holophaga foetida TaxID=35839 RepID=UPI00024717A4|nr:thioredoxin family protein [Holophaga foetida]